MISVVGGGPPWGVMISCPCMEPLKAHWFWPSAGTARADVNNIAATAREMLAFITDLVFVFPFVNRLICIAFFSLPESCKLIDPLDADFLCMETSSKVIHVRSLIPCLGIAAARSGQHCYVGPFRHLSVVAP